VVPGLVSDADIGWSSRPGSNGAAACPALLAGPEMIYPAMLRDTDSDPASMGRMHRDHARRRPAADLRKPLGLDRARAPQPRVFSGYINGLDRPDRPPWAAFRLASVARILYREDASHRPRP
jgi:hypothetical protein